MGFLFALGLMIVSSIIQAVTAKPQGTDAAKPSTFADFKFPQIEEGTPQCVIFGDCWTSDWFVLRTGEFMSQPIKKTASSGKK